MVIIVVSLRVVLSFDCVCLSKSQKWDCWWPYTPGKPDLKETRAPETQMYRTNFWTLWEKARGGCFERTASKHVYLG